MRGEEECDRTRQLSFRLGVMGKLRPAPLFEVCVSGAAIQRAQDAIWGHTHTDGGSVRSSRAPFYIESTAILFFSPQPPELFHQKQPLWPAEEKRGVYSCHLSCRKRRSAGEFTSRTDAFHPRALSLLSYFSAIFPSRVICRFSRAYRRALHAAFFLSSVLQTRARRLEPCLHKISRKTSTQRICDITSCSLCFRLPA